MNEQKEKFNRFLTLCEDYHTAKLAFSAALEAAKGIRDAAAERIRTERKQTADRLAELGTMTADSSRPESARRLWRQELDRLRGRTFSATPEEKAAFDSEITAAAAAVSDLHQLQGRIRDTISDVNQAITTLRAATLGDQSSISWENCIDGEKKGFEIVCREVGT